MKMRDFIKYVMGVEKSTGCVDCAVSFLQMHLATEGAMKSIFVANGEVRGHPPTCQCRT
jgi:hypothetical protein